MMKKFLFLTLLSVLCLSLMAIMMRGQFKLVQASGIATQTNQPGEVKVINQDGVIYLSTETTDIPASTTASIPNQATPASKPFTISDPLAGMIEVPTGFAENITQLLNFVSRLVLAISALLVFGYLIWGAFDWITSGGDKGKVEKARQKITSSVIGLIIISASYAILNLALGFLGLGSLEGALNNVGTIQQGPSPTPETDLSPLIEATPSATPE